MFVVLIMFLLATYGATNILVSSKLFSGVRGYLTKKRGDVWQALACMMKCPMCIGFWVGIWWYVCDLYPHVGYSFEWLSAGSIGSGFVWMVRVVLARLNEDSL